MSKDTVEVPFDGKAGEKAVLLLAAAQATGNEAGVVRTIGGGFEVPREVAEEAGLLGSDDSDEGDKPRKRAAKKAAPKKSDDNDTQE